MNMIKAPKLNKGDKVGIVSLSRGVLGESSVKHQLELGISRLKSFGLESVIMPNALKGLDYLKENPKARAEDLKASFQDDSIRAIICAIGGDDTYKTIPYLLEDPEFIELVKTHPKIFMGFSDTTNNHLMFYKIGLVTYYGPSFLTDFAELDDEMLDYTKKMINYLFENLLSIEIPSSDIWYKERTNFSKDAIGTPRISHPEERGYEVLRGCGIVSGKLLGGCLESLYTLVTGYRDPQQKHVNDQYQIFPSLGEWQDKILFIETCEEKNTPKRFREMVQLFKDIGIFKVIQGMIVGKPQDEVYYDEYCEILKEVTHEENLPILANVNFGHAYPRAILPYGLEVKIDFEEKNLTINESLFSS